MSTEQICWIGKDYGMKSYDTLFDRRVEDCVPFKQVDSEHEQSRTRQKLCGNCVHYEVRENTAYSIEDR